LNNEVRHQLLDELTEDGKEHENGKHLILEPLETERGVEETESNEKRLNS
jgi:hypothetical protein